MSLDFPMIPRHQSWADYSSEDDSDYAPSHSGSDTEGSDDEFDLDVQIPEPEDFTRPPQVPKRMIIDMELDSSRHGLPLMFSGMQADSKIINADVRDDDDNNNDDDDNDGGDGDDGQGNDNKNSGSSSSDGVTFASPAPRPTTRARAAPWAAAHLARMEESKRRLSHRQENNNDNNTSPDQENNIDMTDSSSSSTSSDSNELTFMSPPSSLMKRSQSLESKAPSKSRKRGRISNNTKQGQQPKGHTSSSISSSSAASIGFGGWSKNRSSAIMRNLVGESLEDAEPECSTPSSKRVKHSNNDPSSQIPAFTLADTTPTTAATPTNNNNDNDNDVAANGGDEEKGQASEEARLARRLEQRKKQIVYGKETEGYRNYIALVPKSKRKKTDPRTPDIHQKQCSKRRWDGQIRTWRRQLHAYDDPVLPSQQQQQQQQQQQPEVRRPHSENNMAAATVF